MMNDSTSLKQAYQEAAAIVEEFEKEVGAGSANPEVVSLAHLNLSELIGKYLKTPIQPREYPNGALTRWVEYCEVYKEYLPKFLDLIERLITAEAKLSQ